MAFQRRIVALSQELWTTLRDTFAAKKHTHPQTDITNFSGMRLISFAQSSSVTFSVSASTRVLIIASATKRYNDSNATVTLTLDGSGLHSGYIGDYVNSGGEGGGADEITLAGLRTIGAGQHTVTINHFSSGFIMVFAA